MGFDPMSAAHGRTAPVGSGFFQQWTAVGFVDFLAIYPGGQGLSLAVGRQGCTVAPGIDRNRRTYGRAWDLTDRSDHSRVAMLIRKVLMPICIHFATPCTAWTIIGSRKSRDKDRALAAFSLELLVHQDLPGLVAGHESPGTSSFLRELEKELGSPQQPKGDWRWTVVNGASMALPLQR